MSLCVKQEVVWLDISVNKAGLVDGRDGEDRLGDVEARGVLCERVVLHEQRHHVAAGEELHDQVEVLCVLEAVVELHDPVVVGGGEKVALGTHVCKLRRVSKQEKARKDQADASDASDARDAVPDPS